MALKYKMESADKVNGAHALGLCNLRSPQYLHIKLHPYFIFVHSKSFIFFTQSLAIAKTVYRNGFVVS